MSLNACHCFGIITNNFDFKDLKSVNNIIANIENEYHTTICSTQWSKFYRCTLFNNGIRLIWLRFSKDALKGYRFHRLWIDKTILLSDKTTYDYCIRPVVRGEITLM